MYSVTGEDRSSSADEKIHSTGRKRRLNTKQKTASTDSAIEEEVPTSFEEASKMRVWRDSMKTEVKALQNRGCWRVFQTPVGVRLKIQIEERLDRKDCQTQVKTGCFGVPTTKRH